MTDHGDEERPRGYRGVAGRPADAGQRRPEGDRARRSRQTRQILSGAEIRPPSRISSSYPVSNNVLTQPQQMYAVSLGILLVLGVLLWLIFGMGVASIIFFLLALGLLGGWLAF